MFENIQQHIVSNKIVCQTESVAFAPSRWKKFSLVIIDDVVYIRLTFEYRLVEHIRPSRVLCIPLAVRRMCARLNKAVS